MAKRKKHNQSPFRPKALERYAAPELPPRLGPGERVWRFTLVVPLEEIRPKRRAKATFRDIANIEQLLAKDFRGLSTLPASTGYGLRDRRNPNLLPEMNYNISFVVYAAPLPESLDYFQALQRELQNALDEGVILVERQEVWLV